MILNTRFNSILKPLRVSRLDIESEKMTNLVSLLRRMRSMASVTAYSSALKMLALFGNRTVLAEILATTAKATGCQNLYSMNVKLSDRDNYFCNLPRRWNSCRRVFSIFLTSPCSLLSCPPSLPSSFVDWLSTLWEDTNSTSSSNHPVVMVICKADTSVLCLTCIAVVACEV